MYCYVRPEYQRHKSPADHRRLNVISDLIMNCVIFEPQYQITLRVNGQLDVLFRGLAELMELVEELKVLISNLPISLYQPPNKKNWN